jgi:hypothetical protein
MTSTLKRMSLLFAEGGMALKPGDDGGRLWVSEKAARGTVPGSILTWEPAIVNLAQLRHDGERELALGVANVVDAHAHLRSTVWRMFEFRQVTKLSGYKPTRASAPRLAPPLTISPVKSATPRM